MPEPMFTITEEKLTPEEWAAMEVRRDHFLRNWKWFQGHAVEIGEKYPGKHIVVAGGELFVGDTFRAARDRAAAAHPDDQGVFFRYIPADRGPRLYAHLRRLGG
jgi:hypothetical protein